MGYSVTFIDYTPAERGTDDGPWTNARFEEAGESRRGPWTPIETQALDPQDTDPAAPATRTLTTDLATTWPGWFRVVWIDSNNGEQPTEPEYAGSATRPTVQEVADKMLDRTTIDGGSEARTFNTQTSPTAEEVQRAIDDALDIVDPRVPADADSETERAARKAVTLEACLQIESSNWGDQLEPNEARIALWERLLTSYYAILDSTVTDAETVTDPSAFGITTPRCDDMFDRTGHVARDPYCSPWTTY